MAYPITVIGSVIQAKSESTPNAGASMSAADVVQVVEAPEWTLDYALSGERSGTGGALSGGTYPRVGSSGRFVTTTIQFDGKGRGSAYSLSNLVPNLHPFLECSGLSGSFSSNTWWFRPVAIGQSPKTLAAAIFGRGETLTVSGAVANMTINGNEGAGTVFEFALQGQVGTAVTETVSLPPLHQVQGIGVIPPVNTDIQLTISGSGIGNYTGSVVRGWTYDHGLDIVGRVDRQRANAHAGFATGYRKPVLTVTIEQPRKSEWDVDLAFEQATLYNVSFTVGSTQYNRFGAILSGSQVIAVNRTSDGPVATLEVQLQPTISGPASDSDVTLFWS